MIETVKRPYEFLVRWREGLISGAHVGFEVTTLEDGKVLSTTPLAVIPVNVGQGVGFPLADILAQIQVDAIVSLAEMTALKDAAQITCAQQEATIIELQTALAAAQP